MPEELETVLRLVAEGHLSPEEAAPIIEALTVPRGRTADDDAWGNDDEDLPDLDGLGERITRRVERRVQRAHRRAERAATRANDHLAAARPGMAAPGGRQLRVRITERGRQVVNLRIPVGFVDAALRFVPGLAGEQAQRIRDAVSSGAVGPILDVEDPDGEGGVLISVE